MSNEAAINAKRAMLRLVDRELDGLTGRFLSNEEQLRVRSINEEQERLEREIIELGGEP
jgi:hypothetical protein